MNVQLLTNNENIQFYDELKVSIQGCEKFYFSVAFINYSGLQLLLDPIKSNPNVKGKVITSTYLNFTDTNSLEKLNEYKNIDTRVFVTDNHKRGFHTKAYIFEYKDYFKVIVGSSNITSSALKSNIEWNLAYYDKKNSDTVEKVLEEYNKLYDASEELTSNFIDEYSKFINSIEKTVKHSGEFKYKVDIKPNYMQKKAMVNLDELRKSGESKALVIAATGSGKTYMSAFDVRKARPARMLFLVHRGEIIKKSIIDYKLIINDNVKFGILDGDNKDYDSDYLFANISTLSKESNMRNFEKDSFDYIVIDEAHRVGSESYKKVIDYFKPKFLLGMTATPNRTDGIDIFEMFDKNVALDIRLSDALEHELVVPFHYYGITDATCDISQIKCNNISELSKKLRISNRIDFIIEKMLHYGFDGNKRRCLGFCIDREHSKYMAEEFNSFGYKSISLDGSNTIEERRDAISKIESGEIEFIFTVDIFNEGVDIPSINSVLMLRPTQSSIIFAQQLGRGLRKTNKKDFLTVLDFIGNHSRAFLVTLALNGNKYYDKDSLKVSVKTNFKNIPGCSHIQLDEISKQRILAQIESTNFYLNKYIQEQYNEFKNSLGRVPNLVDFAINDNAPNTAMLYQTKYKNKRCATYHKILCVLESDYKYKDHNDYIVGENFIKFLSSSLPVVRIHDFIILKSIINCTSLTTDEVEEELKKHLDVVNKGDIIHSMRYLSGEFLDSNEKENIGKMFEYNDGKLESTEKFELAKKSELFNWQLSDILDYGIIIYKSSHGRVSYQNNLKVYNTYRMRDLGLATNYEKSHSSIRGQGVWRNKKQHFFFVTLNKDEYIKDSINYADKVHSREYFQWESPNSTSQKSELGKVYTGVTKGQNIFLFIRKNKQENNVSQRFIYVGEIEPISFKNNKPIEIQYQFKNKLTQRIFDELTK